MLHDKVRVLRLLEYVGPRDWVEQTIAQSINGRVRCGYERSITAVTLTQYPEVLENAVEKTMKEYQDEKEQRRREYVRKSGGVKRGGEVHGSGDGVQSNPSAPNGEAHD